MNRGLVSALVVLLPFAAISQTQGTPSARAFVQQVYADYANPDRRHQEQRQNKFYTGQLYRLIVADRTGHPGEVGNLDGDPICDCQDPGHPGQLKVQSIALSASTPASLKATVGFVIVHDPRTVTLLLLKTPSGWRIDDIATKDTPSLRALLRK
jgi:hypothetical protein